MNASELIAAIEQHPTKLILDQKIRFAARKTRLHPLVLDDLLVALQQTRSIETIELHGNLCFGLTQDEWSRTIASLGRVPNLRHLRFVGDHVPITLPLDALAACVQNTRREERSSCSTCNTNTLTELKFGEGVIVYGEWESVAALQAALMEHPSLETFDWRATLRFRNTPLLPPAHRFDAVVEALRTCSKLHTVRLTHFVNEFLDLSTAAVESLYMFNTLHIQTTHWHAIATILKHVQCAVHTLIIQQRSASLFDCQPIANALKANFTVQSFSIRSQTGFTEDAAILLARSLRHNMGLKFMQVGVRCTGSNDNNNNNNSNNNNNAVHCLTVPALTEFHTMLQRNGFCRLDLDPLLLLKEVSAPSRRGHYTTLCAQIRIQSTLNGLGLSRLLHSEAPKSAWMEALQTLLALFSSSASSTTKTATTTSIDDNREHRQAAENAVADSNRNEEENDDDSDDDDDDPMDVDRNEETNNANSTVNVSENDFQLDCLYTVLRANPLVCQLEDS